jgi:hypothetical protein
MSIGVLLILIVGDQVSPPSSDCVNAMARQPLCSDRGEPSAHRPSGVLRAAV